MVVQSRKSRKSRNTKQKELLHKIVGSFDSFFHAEELHVQALKHDASLGIATVYRFLREEKAKGNLYAYVCDRKMLYAKGAKSHCHFHCEETKQTFHFDLDDLSFLKHKVPGKIKSIQLEVTGICDTCSK